ncbi:MAG: Alkyl hydroperoxide reductase, F subunit [Parcubacteria group bacterium GW2011_GWD2_40_9]|nr:MAG: Alkyl hydroperoxide reductase, F subunit [Parcubacteria group bacterium GW2011_GWD2_40_9]
MKTVLITAIAGDIAQGVATILRETFPKWRLIGTDIHARHGGNLFVDQLLQAPRADDPGYDEWLGELIERESIDICIPMSEAELLHLSESGKVEFMVNAQIKEIKGSNFVEKIIYTDRVSGQDRELDAQGVFVNIGQSPNSGFVKDFLEINKFGEIIIDPKTNETSVKGVFAAGDITDTGHKQYVVAAGQGANALLNAYEYLKNKTRGL